MRSKGRNELYRGVMHDMQVTKLRKKIEHCMTGKARDKAYRGGDGGYKVA